MNWAETRLPADHCPLCGYKHDAASSPTGKTPSPGDLAVCMSCATALVFGEDLRLQAMTQDEFADLHPDERKEVLRFQRAIRMLDRRQLKGHHLR